MTALAYIRVSSRNQVRGDGLPQQKQTIARYARAHRIKDIEYFQDKGVSGTKDSVDRPGLNDLLHRLVGNGIKCVLVARADRLARDLIVGELLLKEFRDLGVKVIAADSGADLTVGDDDPTSKLIRQVLGAVAEFDKCMIVLRLRKARIKKRRLEGRCEGRKPYGEFEGEDEVIERIKKLRKKPPNRKRLSYALIAQTLNDDGVPTRGGKPWRPSSVQAIAKANWTEQ